MFRARLFIERIGWVMALLALGLIALALVRNWQQIPPVDWSLSLAMAAAAGVFTNVVVMALNSHVWRLLMAGASVRVSPSRAFVICAKSQIWKYLPGNVFHVVGRGGLAVREGISLEVAVSSMTLEILLMAITGFLVAMPILWSRWEDVSGLYNPPALSGLSAAAVAAASGLAVAWWFFGGRLRRAAATALRMANVVTLAKALLYYTVAFLITGGAIYLFASFAWPGKLAFSPSACIGSFALAWVIGFLTPGAPGGLGIREAVFFALLGGTAGGGVAATLAVVSRLQAVAGELLTFLVGLAVEKAMKRR
jgi:glycosyltransferase 2 family protein